MIPATVVPLNLARSGGELEPEQSAVVVVDQLIQELRGAWRFRWHAMVVAWGTFVTGFLVICGLPNVYEANAKIYVDASSRLRPLLQGLAVDTNVDAQVAYVRQTLLSRPHLTDLVSETSLSRRAKTAQHRDRLVDRLKEEIIIDASRSTEQTAGRLYTLTYRDSDRDTALSVVRSLVAGFVKGSKDSNRAQSEEAQEFLHLQLKDLEVSLAEAEERLAEFKKRNFGALPGQSGDYFTRVQGEREKLEEARRELNVLLSQRAELLNQLNGEKPLRPLARPDGSSQVQPEKDLDTRIKEADAKLEDLLLRYTEKHPEVIALRESITEMRARRAQEIATMNRGGTGSGVLALADNPLYQSIRIQLNKVEVDIAAAREDLSDHERRIRQLQVMIDTAPDVEAELARLNRDYGVTKVRYETLLDRLQRAKLAEEAEETGSIKFEIIDPPASKMRPVGPKRLLMIIGVFGVALGCGGVAAYLLQQIKPVFPSSAALAQATRLPVLGVVSLVRLEAHAAQTRASVLRYCAVTIVLVACFLAALAFRDVGATLLQTVIG